MQNSFITIALPFAGDRADRAEAAIEGRLGNPVAEAVRQRLDATARVHFMSLCVLRGTPPEGAHLVFEISADGDPRTALAAIVDALGQPLGEVLDEAGVDCGSAPTADHLMRFALKPGPGWFRSPGICFTGSPGFSVRRIRAERDLANRIAGMRDVLEARLPPAEKLRRVRQRLWAEGWKWAFVPEPAPFLGQGKDRTPLRVALVFAAALASLIWPLALVPLLLWPWLGLWPALGTGLLVLLLLLVAAAIHLRRLELADRPDDSPPDAATLARILRHENRIAQNLLAAESRMKPGWFRRVTLRFAFAAVGQGVAQIFRPGFLRRIGVIHYARWALIPGTDRLMFWSNFSDSWEGYLEDFIEKAPSGLTSVWSNTQGFPRTRFLFGDGAEDGDRFRRWARRQQIVIPFWYSGYPDVKLPRIRRDAAIRQGIAMARTDADAEAWLACFGSEPRPAHALDKPEIPTMVFGALSRCRSAEALVLRLPDDARAARAWLHDLAPEVSFGERRGGGPAAMLGLSATGLARLGVADTDLATFPAAFQHGMAEPGRARALGDDGPQAPEHWLWGQPGTADAYLMLLDGDAARLEATVARQVAAIRSHGGEVSYRRRLKDLPEYGPVQEPFGFVDGVSQPILRDTPRARRAGNGQHVVEAGEMVLGYPDNRGYVPPTPTIATKGDPLALLPALATPPTGAPPCFADSGTDGRRDFGRNGTFLVVRHLDQDVAAFKSYLTAEAERLVARPDCPWPLYHVPVADRPREIRDMLAAKMVGRWQDGASLVRHGGTHHHPHSTQRREPDNDFLFAREDPQGLHCPFGAHVRRTNPRDSENMDGPEQLALSNRHRILRIGRQYEPDAESGTPGLMFMCLNADIERQYEFLQRNWVLNPNFHDLLDEQDPLMGRNGGHGTFTIPTRQGPVQLRGLPDFVRVRGGGYFFLPSRRALAWLATGPAGPAAHAPAPRAPELTTPGP
jgi:deferrochelatase/peroxidase EfeB